MSIRTKLTAISHERSVHERPAKTVPSNGSSASSPVVQVPPFPHCHTIKTEPSRTLKDETRTTNQQHSVVGNQTMQLIVNERLARTPTTALRAYAAERTERFFSSDQKALRFHAPPVSNSAAQAAAKASQQPDHMDHRLRRCAEKDTSISSREPAERGRTKADSNLERTEHSGHTCPGR